MEVYSDHNELIILVLNYGNQSEILKTTCLSIYLFQIYFTSVNNIYNKSDTQICRLFTSNKKLKYFINIRKQLFKINKDRHHLLTKHMFG